MVEFKVYISSTALIVELIVSAKAIKKHWKFGFSGSNLVVSRLQDLFLMDGSHG